MTLIYIVLGTVLLAIGTYRLAWAWGFRLAAMVVDLMILTPLLCSRLVPVPLLPWIYRALGASIGRGTHIVGVICDPPLTVLGDRCLVGSDAMITAHALDEGAGAMSYAPVVVGNDVLIGAKAIVMSGVVIEDGARIAAGAVVPKWAHVGKGETWAGVPARNVAHA